MREWESKGPGINVLHLISSLDTGGAEMFLSRLLEGIDKEKYNNTVVSMTDIGPVGGLIQEKGVGVHALGMKKGLPDPKGMVRLIALIKKKNIDILQCWMYHANLMGITAKLCCPSVRCIWNIRCSAMQPGTYGRVYDLTVAAGALLSGLPDTVVVNSHTGKRNHQAAGYRNRRWAVLHNGIDCDRFQSKRNNSAVRRELGLPDSAFVVSCVARFDPMKDHRTFFRAARMVLEKKSNIHFVLAGRGMEAANTELIDFTKDIRQKDNIHLLGERRDIDRLYGISHIACSSSAFGEGFSNAIAEAMAASLPCVVTDTGDSGFIVGNTGVVVPPKDPRALADGILEMIEKDGTALGKMGGNAHRRISRLFRLDTTIKRYERLYGAMVH